MTDSTNFTPETRERLRVYLATHEITTDPRLINSTDSLGTINLVLTGKATQAIPQCMSFVIGRWITLFQDALPNDLRNSLGYKAALLDSVDTGRHPHAEQARLEVILTSMWETVLPTIQEAAELGGYGPEWLKMCELKTYAAATKAFNAIETISFSRNGNLQSSFVAQDAARTFIGPNHQQAWHASCTILYGADCAHVFGTTKAYWARIKPLQLFTLLASIR